MRTSEYTVRSTHRDSGTSETATTDSSMLAILLCEAVDAARWWMVELEDNRGRVLWATYVKYDPTAYPEAYASLAELSERGA